MAVNWDEFTPVEESSESENSIDWNQFTPIDEPRRKVEAPIVAPPAGPSPLGLMSRFVPAIGSMAQPETSTAEGLLGSAQKGIERGAVIPDVIQAIATKPGFSTETRPSALGLTAHFLPAVRGLLQAQQENVPWFKETVKDIAQQQQKIAEIPQSAAQQRMGRATTQSDKWGAWLQDPVELTTSIVLESLPPSLVGAGVGAAGGPAGMAAGVGLASGLTEFSSTFLDEAGKQGYNVQDPVSLEKFLNDSKAYNAAIDKGITRAGIVGGVDAITGGTAGRFLKPALAQALKQRVIATGKEFGVQALGGAGGEAAAQIATGQPLDPFDITMEAVAEFGSAQAEIAGNLRGEKAKATAPVETPPTAIDEAAINRGLEKTAAEQPPATPQDDQLTKTYNYSPEDLAEYERLQAEQRTMEQSDTIKTEDGTEFSPAWKQNWEALKKLTNKYNGNPPKQKQPPKTPPLQPGERLVLIQKPDGTTEYAMFADKTWDFGTFGGIKTMVGKLSKDNPEKWSHGVLNEGEKIIEIEQPTAQQEEEAAPPAPAAPAPTVAQLSPGEFVRLRAANQPILAAALNPAVKPPEGWTLKDGFWVPPGTEQTTETAAQTEPAKELISMGGELATAQPTGTTLANASGEQERTDFGLPAAYPKVSRKMLPVWNASADVLRKDPKAGEKLAAELKINPERGMTDEDSALLLRHKVALENAKNQAAEDSITAGTPEAKQEAMDRFDNISNQLLDLLDAAKFRGSQWGREGRWRQALAFEDYSFESMRRQKRMKADRELTPEEEAETKREYEDIAAKQKAAEAARVKDEQNAREAQAKEVVAETIKTARTRQTRQKAAGVVRDLAAEQAEIVAYLKDHFIENGDLSDTQSSIKKLMEILVEREGIAERLPLETRVHEILSAVDPTLTREGTLDLMSGYGKSKLPSQEPAKKTVRDISQQIISVRKLLDYFKGKRPSLTGMLRDAPSDIQRGWISMVNEAKKVFKLDVPVDNARSIKSATDAINTRLKNRISDLKQEIATRQKIIRERSPSPYNAETLKLRQELESLQAQHAEIFGSGLTPAQQLDRLEKSAERQIEELERQIKSGEIFPKSRQAVGLTSDKLDAAKAKIEELKLQRQFAREALQPRAEPEVAKNEARISALDKQIAAIEKQLADDAVFSKSKKPRTPSEDARVLEREKKLAELKQERQFARERNQPGMEPHEQFLLNYLLRVRQREAAYKEKLAKGEFEKQPNPKRELSPAVLSALADVEKAKSDFQRGLHQYELSRRSRIQKIWDAIRNTKNAFVNIISSYDFSAPRQAFAAILANVSRLVTSPVQGSKLLAIPFQKMFQAWSGERRSATIDQWIKNRPNATSGADKTAGIQYTDLHSTTFSKAEENARSVLDDWAALPLRTGNALKSTVTFLPKVGAKGVRMSNRAFITYLNTTRALLFDELLRANFQDRAPTEAQLKVLGNIVNLSTGRGALNQGVARVASEILWAPSLLTSRVQLLTGQPFWGKAGREGGGKARLIVAKEYARWITSAAVLFAISQMFDEKDEDEEPTSSDFGKVVRGNTRIDPWAGFQQVAVLMARIRAGETTSIEGQSRNIAKTGIGEVVWNFFKNKARPDLVAAVKATIAAIDLGKDEKDVRVTPAEAVRSAVPVPLAIREVIEVMRDRGMTEGAIVEALALFGAGVSVYEEREAQK